MQLHIDLPKNLCYFLKSTLKGYGTKIAPNKVEDYYQKGGFKMDELMARSREREQFGEEKTLLPFFFGTETQKTRKVSDRSRRKLDLFEETLEKQLDANDNLDTAFQKIVKIALAAEFGPSILHSKGTAKMVATIARGIREDHELRRSALSLLYRYSSKKSKK